MKVLIVCALIAAVRGAGLHYSGIINTGASTVHRSQDTLGNYAFGYDEAHATGGTFRKEVGSPGVKVGSYGLTDIDGRQRVVSYVADAAGYRADIRSNEPGVGATAQDPAHTNINKDAIVIAAAPAPVVAAPVVAAPIAAVPSAPAAVAVGAPLAAAVEATDELTQAVESPIEYSAGRLSAVATKAITTHAIATPVVAHKAVAVAPVAHYAAHVAPAVAHVGPVAHYAAHHVAPAVSHYAAHVAPAHVAHYASHIAPAHLSHVASHVSHYSAAPVPSSYSTAIHHGYGVHPAYNHIVY